MRSQNLVNHSTGGRVAKRTADIAMIQDVIADETRMDIMHQLEELDSVSNLPEYAKSARRTSLLRWSDIWRRSCPRVMLKGILNGDGTALEDHNAACEAVRNHWSRVHADPSLQPENFQRFASFVQKCPDDIPWDLTREEFDERVGRAKFSSPGPDGICYLAWARAGSTARSVLWELYERWRDTGTLPQGFNHGFLALLPKGQEMAETPGMRSPDAIRPLTLSNTDSKILAGALNKGLSAVATRCVHPDQNGFVKGRSIIDNIVHIEGAIQRHLLIEGNEPGTVMFDFKQAFPSLGHDWIRFVLKKMRIPVRITRAILALYGDIYVDIMMPGGCVKGFVVKCGIKQGCPLSGTLFAICLDPCLRFIVHLLPPCAGSRHTLMTWWSH